MVKLLSDICLSVVQTSLDRVPNVRNLPTVYKELLLERLACHDMFSDSYISHVAYNLFSVSLRRINFHKCPQITDNVLKLLKSSQCKLESLTLNTCVNISGKVTVT